jgi:hypothetical protein
LFLELTHNIERDKVAAVRLRADLTLVVAGVPLLGPLDLQRPLLILTLMDRLKPLVTGVRIAAHGQYVDVSVPDP